MPAYTDPKPESRAIVADYIAKGKDGSWLWTNLCKDVCKSEGLDLGDRAAEASDYAAKILRGFYPGRESVWDLAFKNRTPADIDTEYDHIIGICVMEAHFTLTKRPVPPKPEPKPKAETPTPPDGEAKPKKGKKAKAAVAEGEAPAPPPAPAPAPAPAAPPPPPAG